MSDYITFVRGFVKDTLSWKYAKCDSAAWQNRQSCRARYQWEVYRYLARNWISSCVSCH